MTEPARQPRHRVWKNLTVFHKLKFAWHGMKAVFQSELSFKIELACAVLVILAGFIFKLGRFEWLCLILAIGIVFIAEFVNTAIETTLDHLHPEIHREVKVAKDIAAAAVFIANMTAITIAILVFSPRVLALFNR